MQVNMYVLHYVDMFVYVLHIYFIYYTCIYRDRTQSEQD